MGRSQGEKCYKARLLRIYIISTPRLIIAPDRFPKSKIGEACAESLKFIRIDLFNHRTDSPTALSRKAQAKAAECTAGIFRESRGVPGRAAPRRRRMWEERENEDLMAKVKSQWLVGAEYCERRTT